jgi:hypothetical protein
MSWRRRLAELTVAGGLTASGCLKPTTSFVCNANPDPCCFGENAGCTAEKACATSPTPACCTEFQEVVQFQQGLTSGTDAGLPLPEACAPVLTEVSNCSTSEVPECCEVSRDAGKINDAPCCVEPNGTLCLELTACLAAPSPACCASLWKTPTGSFPDGIPEPCATIIIDLQKCGTSVDSACCANGEDAGGAPAGCFEDGGIPDAGSSTDGGSSATDGGRSSTDGGADGGP